MSSMSRFAIITGSNTGLGLHLAKALYASGKYNIVLACRNMDKGERAVEEIRQHQTISDTPTAEKMDVQCIQLDLVDPLSVQRFVDDFTRICSPGNLHLLINNAAIMGNPYQLVKDVEIHFSANYLGHYLLTNLLIDSDQFAGNARILNITSSFYEKCKSLLTHEELKSPVPLMSPTQYYSHSKLANCLHTIALSKRIEEMKPVLQNVKVLAIRPGFVHGTELGRHTNLLLRILAAPLIWLIAKDLDKGIATTMHCIQSEDSLLTNGALYYEGGVIPYNEVVNDDNANKLWEMSEYLLQNYKIEKF